MEAHNRSVPYNNDAEMYVIGSVLLENKIMNSLVGKINPEDFYNPHVPFALPQSAPLHFSRYSLKQKVRNEWNFLWQ